MLIAESEAILIPGDNGLLKALEYTDELLLGHVPDVPCLQDLILAEIKQILDENQAYDRIGDHLSTIADVVFLDQNLVIPFTVPVRHQEHAHDGQSVCETSDQDWHLIATHEVYAHLNDRQGHNLQDDESVQATGVLLCPLVVNIKHWKNVSNQ